MKTLGPAALPALRQLRSIEPERKPESGADHSQFGMASEQTTRYLAGLELGDVSRTSKTI